MLDAAGKIYIAGSAYTGCVGTPASVYSNDAQFNFPTTSSAYQPIVLGGNSYSAHVTKFSADGKSLLYSTMFGGPNQNTYNNALAIGAGKIFIGGYYARSAPSHYPRRHLSHLRGWSNWRGSRHDLCQ